jgi:colanic acid/amylovoran biosynthesis glycosyltransferase
MSGGRDIAVCVAEARPCAEVETFVRDQVDRLPARTTLLCGKLLDRTTGGRRCMSTLGARTLAALGRYGLRREWYPALEARRLTRWLAHERPSVVLAQFGPTGVRFTEPCRRSGVPLVVHFHGYDVYRHATVEALREQYARMFAQCAAVIAVSRDMERRLAELGAAPQKVHYNPCGADCDLFTPTDASANPPVFVAVGRLVPVKGPRYVVQAFREVLDACPEARLRMVGDGPLMATCRALSESLGLAKAVEFCGRLAHAQVPEAMRGARTFVQHSVATPEVKCEGMPVSVMEAGACGLPAVVTRNGGIPDVVLDGQTGFLVDEGDVSGMAGRMVELARDPALAGRLGRAARERVCAEFSMDRSIERLARILAEAAGR